MLPRALIITFAAALTALVHTIASPVALPAAAGSGPVAADAFSVSLEQTVALFEDAGVVFIDASRRDEYAAGHIPGALNVPLTRFAGGSVPDELEYFAKTATVVVYCPTARCDAAVRVAGFLRAFGHEKVFVFHAGFEAWKKAGRPVER